MQVLWKFSHSSILIHQHSKLVLAVGPLHLFLPPLGLTPHHSSPCTDIPPQRGLSDYPTQIAAGPSPCSVALWHSLLPETIFVSISSLEGQLCEARNFTLFLAIFLELYTASSIIVGPQ